jgi:hypothetical protein
MPRFCHDGTMKRTAFPVVAAVVAFAAVCAGASLLTIPALAETRWLEAGRGFSPPIADPRESRMALDYGDGGHWSLRAGHTLTLLRKGDDHVATRYGLDGGIWMWFRTEGGVFVFPLQTDDGSVGLWAERAGPRWAGRFRWGHWSAHRGDGADQRESIIYSREWVAAMVAYRPSSRVRVYGGPGAWVRADPRTQAMMLQTGAEWRTEPRGVPWGTSVRPFAAADFQWRAEWDGRIQQSYAAGLEARGGPDQTMRLSVGYRTGFSPRGQEWRTVERLFTVGLSFSD